MERQGIVSKREKEKTKERSSHLERNHANANAASRFLVAQQLYMRVVVSPREKLRKLELALAHITKSSARTTRSERKQ